MASLKCEAVIGTARSQGKVCNTRIASGTRREEKATNIEDSCAYIIVQHFAEFYLDVGQCGVYKTGIPLVMCLGIDLVVDFCHDLPWSSISYAGHEGANPRSIRPRFPDLNTIMLCTMRHWYSHYRTTPHGIRDKRASYPCQPLFSMDQMQATLNEIFRRHLVVLQWMEEIIRQLHVILAGPASGTPRKTGVPPRQAMSRISIRVANPIQTHICHRRTTRDEPQNSSLFWMRHTLWKYRTSRPMQCKCAS